MNGIERARHAYEIYGKSMIQSHFPSYENKIAVGICGNGSDCFGYDDDTSMDHDFFSIFSLYLDKETYKEIGNELTIAFQRLNKRLGIAPNTEHPDRRGVFEISNFFQQFTALDHLPTTTEEWFSIPEYALSCATNGDVFQDTLGLFTSFQKHLLWNRPEDVRLQKIAANIALMAQSGQYNFSRCIQHGEEEAAQMALYEFVKRTISLIYLLNFTYEPYYKWSFRKLKELPVLSNLSTYLSQLLLQNISLENKRMLIEQVSKEVILELHKEGLSSSTDPYLEPHANIIKAKITDPYIKEKHLMDLGAI